MTTTNHIEVQEPAAVKAAAAALERAHNDVVDAAAAVVSYAVDVPARGVATVPFAEMFALREAVRAWREAGETLVRLQRGDG